MTEASEEPALDSLCWRSFITQRRPKTFTMLSPGWQDGRWGEGVIRFRRCLREIETSFCLHTVFLSASMCFFFQFAPLFCLLLTPLLALSLCIMWRFHSGYNSSNRRWPVGNATSLYVSSHALTRMHLL